MSMATKDIEDVEIGSRLKWLRELEGMTQEEFASRAGLTGRQYQNWESGTTSLSISGARALRRTYRLSLDFMFEGIDDALPMNLSRAWRDRPSDSQSK